jgi:hypothetical protein
MINESGRAFPQMVVYDKQRSEVKKTIKSWIPGKVIKTDGIYTTQASSKTSPWRIYMGLYDKNALILEETEGRVVEGYLSDGRMVYFDIITPPTNNLKYVIIRDGKNRCEKINPKRAV